MKAFLRKLAGISITQKSRLPARSTAVFLDASARATSGSEASSLPNSSPIPSVGRLAPPSWSTTAASLPPPERLARICEILSAAVVRDWAHRAVVDSPPPEPTASTATPPAASTGDRIVAYLALIGNAGMADIRETLGLPKMQAYRATVALIASGRLVAAGRSHQTTYSLSPAEAAKAELN